jgi:hypothetical protein
MGSNKSLTCLDTIAVRWLASSTRTVPHYLKKTSITPLVGARVTGAFKACTAGY